jgi:hypothetical protein
MSKKYPGKKLRREVCSRTIVFLSPGPTLAVNRLSRFQLLLRKLEQMIADALDKPVQWVRPAGDLSPAIWSIA